MDTWVLHFLNVLFCFTIQIVPQDLRMWRHLKSGSSGVDTSPKRSTGCGIFWLDYDNLLLFCPIDSWINWCLNGSITGKVRGKTFRISWFLQLSIKSIKCCHSLKIVLLPFQPLMFLCLAVPLLFCLDGSRRKLLVKRKKPAAEPDLTGEPIC